MTRRPPSSPLFPSPTLFRSRCQPCSFSRSSCSSRTSGCARGGGSGGSDRKSTRLNSSHNSISFSLCFFNDTAPPELSSLPLPDALPISMPPLLLFPLLLFLPYFWMRAGRWLRWLRSEEHTSELQSQFHILFPLFF